MARENAKKSFRLSRKQFIIILAAVCGIALIIEGALLIRMFAKNRKKPASEEKKPVLVGVVEPEKGRTAESYIRREYQTYGDGEPELETVKQVEYDDEGRLYHVYLWEEIRYRGPPYRIQSSVDTFYSYDNRGRILQENQRSKEYSPISGDSHEETRSTSYDYKDVTAPEVLIQTVNGNGELKSRTEEKYNENGVLIALVTYEYIDGNEIKTEDKTFDERGNVVSEILVKLYGDGKIDWTEKNKYTYYESGVRKTSVKEVYDENNLMSSLQTAHYNGYGVEISRDYFNRDGLEHVIVYDENERKSTRDTGDGKAYFNEEGEFVRNTSESILFDEQGRIIRREKEDGHEIIKEDYFYSKDGKSASRRTRRVQRKYNGKESQAETVFDSNGRILQTVEVDWDGNETRIRYDWNYKDIRYISGDVLQVETYENGEKVKEALFIIRPVAEEEELREWYWSYGASLGKCRHKYHNEQDERGAVYDYKDICVDYVSPCGQYHLETFHTEVFDKESRIWNIVTEATFHPNGTLKSVRSREKNSVWYFDDRGNHIRTEQVYSDGEIGEVNELEYTYYKGISGETPEPEKH